MAIKAFRSSITHNRGDLMASIKTAMLKLAIAALLWLIAASISAQDLGKSLNDMIQGIKQEGVTFYEVSGYQIFHQKLKAPLSEKTIKKFKKKYDFAKDYTPVSKSLNGEFLVFESKRSTNEESPELGRSYYTYEDDSGNGFLIGFANISSRDTAIENYMAKSIRDGTLPETVYSPQNVDSIKFAGRYIQLGPVCRWMNTHNIQCPNYGQMNWSEFSDSTRAAEMTEFQRLLNNQKFLGKEKESSYVNVLFEGSEVQVLKSKVKMKIPEFVMGGSNVLIVYYVTSKVRDRYVSCVLSHFTDDVNADDLPPLLGEVLEKL